MAFLYTDMAELKSRLDRFDAFHVGLNTQLDTVMSKLERLEAPVLTQSVLDRVGYLQLRFKAGVADLLLEAIYIKVLNGLPNPEPKEKAANVIKKLGEVGYNKRVNIGRAFGYLSDQFWVFAFLLFIPELVENISTKP